MYLFIVVFFWMFLMFLIVRFICERGKDFVKLKLKYFVNNELYDFGCREVNI